MCNKCLKTLSPDRGNTCYDTGVYFQNFKSCDSCKQVNIPIKKIASQQETHQETEESVQFDHICPECSHIIAKHSYTFTLVGESIEEQAQESTMDCNLCGIGQDSQWVLSRNPNSEQ
jgi:hypothetical protein